MIDQITTWILESLRAHGPLSVFLGVIIESVIVPIPSPMIIMGAGAILIEPHLGASAAFWLIFKLIVLPGAIASTLGAYIGYGIGYGGGKPLIVRLEKFLGFGWDDVERIERRLMSRRAGPMIFLLRAVPIVPLSLISAVAGLIRLPAASFTWWTFLGSLPRCLLLGYLGWSLRDAYHGLAHRLNSYESLISAGIVALAFGIIFWLRWRVRKSI
ncbi:MAG: VTT domain-containing protein [Elusimicrobia bacterium]|nr:VTT domain-containing protein [Elusimicrobiota bacterium]